MIVEMERQPHLPDVNDHMSENRSFGSNCYPCSQSRKISMGLVVDSSAKMKAKHVKGVLAELQTSENVTSAKDIPAQNEQKGEEVVAPTLGTQNKALHQETSPWIYTKKLYQKTLYSDAIDHTSNVLLQSIDRNISDETHSVQIFANQMSILHVGDVNEKKFKRMAYQRKGGNDGTLGREEFSHATAQKLLVPTKGMAEQGTSEIGNNGNETLRKKLQEILGTVSSPNKQQFNSENLETDTKISKPEFKTNKRESQVAMPRQHSDSIETDSGSLDHTIRRQVTRFLTWKKPQAQISAGKKAAPFCRYKQARLGKNDFSFVEGWSQRQSINPTSTMYKRKVRERKFSGTELLKICIPERANKDETQQISDRRRKKDSDKTTSLLENRSKGLINVHPKNIETVEAKNGMKEEAPHQHKVIMIRDLSGGNNGPNLQYNVDQQDPFAKPSFMNNIAPQYVLRSPTFELKTAIKISSSESLIQAKQEDLEVDSPAERAFHTGGIHRPNSPGTSKGGYYNGNTKNLAVGLGDSHVEKSVLLVKEAHKENRHSVSLSGELESESFEDSSPITVPTIKVNLKENRRSRSPCEEVGSEVSEDDTPIKGDGDGDDFHGPSEQDGLDGLAGAVTLFTLALERVKRKMHSTTSRQAAEIFLSVSKNIHLQLQNVESHIQIEVGKLTSFDKSKRKRLKHQCQGNDAEQQEQLKQIYERFKEEVDQHLHNCWSTLEGLEAHQMTVKGMVEKQRLSHKKLLLQTEEAIETLLIDAQRRLADVHRLGRERMLQLKYGIGKCLKEGTVS